MLTVVMVLWVPVGLLNMYVMYKADEARGMPTYWIKDRGAFVKVMSIIGGLVCLPFTILAACEWAKNRLSS